jgi:hypothetical protein
MGVIRSTAALALLLLIARVLPEGAGSKGDARP